MFLGLPCGGLFGRPTGRRAVLRPPLFLEVESFLEIVHYSFICSFGVTVALWISGARGLDLDFPLYAKIIEYL